MYIVPCHVRHSEHSIYLPFMNLREKGRSFHNKIIGDKSNLSLTQRIYNASCIVTIITLLISVIWNISVGYTLLINYALIAILFVVGFLYYLSRFQKKSYNLLFVTSILITLSIAWFMLEGSRGTTPIFFILAIPALVAFSKPKEYLIYFLIGTLSIVVLFLLEKNQFIQVGTYPSEEVRLQSLYMAYAITLIFGSMLFMLFKNNHEREKKVIQKQKAELEELNKTKNKFFSIISHDLRSPFSGILGISQLLAENDLSKEDSQELAKELRKTSQKTYNLLENLLAWAKMKQGAMSFEPVTINLQEFTEILINSVHYTNSSEKGIKIFNQIDPDLKIIADDHMLQVILGNLISNAVKFSHMGQEVKILSSASANGKVTISVEDNGIGMDKKLIQNLFKLDKKTGRKGTIGESSSGLGLILCKEFLEQHQSHLNIESKVDQGSKFYFSLQVAD